MTSAAAGQRLPAADDRIDISRVEFQPVAPPAGALGGDQGGSAAQKGVEHDVAAGRAVEVLLRRNRRPLQEEQRVSALRGTLLSLNVSGCLLKNDAVTVWIPMAIPWRHRGIGILHLGHGDHRLGGLRRL
jgi:hypothetical protein